MKNDPNPVYLHDIPLPEAIARWQSALQQAGLWRVLGMDEIALDESAVGRVLAQPIWARLSSPHYHASAMDGFAVRASDTRDAATTHPLTLTCPGQAAYLDTGDALPDWADAVIPIELVEPLDAAGALTQAARQPGAIRIRAAVTPWSHVRPIGEDMVATQLVLPAGHTLRPVDLGAIAASGHTRLQVARKPRVAVLPTGSELVEIGQPVQAGQIIEFNSLVLAAQVNSWGGSATRFPITHDDLPSLLSQVRQASQEHDLILLNAGSSAGSEDFSAEIVQTLGTLLVHGIAVRPGHPVILGMLERQPPAAAGQVPIIGVPGYPVSAALTGEILVEPLLACWLGRRPYEPELLQAQLTRKITSPAGDDDYMRVAVGKVGNKVLAAPLARGSGVISSLVRADGITILKRGTQGLDAGAQVQVRLYRPAADLERTILAIGSHDMTLDLLAQFLSRRERRLSSANAGSLGGLVALRRSEAHFAGSHLLDPETGEYNLSYIRQYLPGVPVKVIGMVGRDQGLMVGKGNPKWLRALADLAREDIRFVNRQRGAGTRVLLDYHLAQLGIPASQVQGYEREEYTHLAVAAAVASGRVDCGLGIAAAAQALDLDFIPLYNERYELIIPAEFYSDPVLLPLFEVLADPEFRRAVEALPGYSTQEMGKMIVEVA